MSRLARLVYKSLGRVEVALAVAFGLFLLVAAVGGAVKWVGRALEGPPTARVTDFGSEEWRIICTANSSAPASADENFSGPVLDGYANNRGPAFVEREYPGTRVWANVRVERAGAGAAAGTYKLFGTVKSVDLANRTAVLTDCLFVPR